jgi:UDP-glucose 4-epimerase
MRSALITGGAGFFGGILTRTLLDRGFSCVSIDLQPHDYAHTNLTPVKADICDQGLLGSIVEKYQPEAIFHCAAIMAHGREGHDFLWSTNVEGTRNVAEAAKQCGVKRFIFVSTNCLWTENLHRPIREAHAPAPVEIYGKSKLEGEQILEQYAGSFALNIIRCPAIIDPGRLGLLAILFDFIQEGRKVWIPGNGQNRYQFVCGRDAADACLHLLDSETGIFHAGSDNVLPLRDVYQYVIDHADSRSRIVCLPKGPSLFAMKAAHKLGLSPLPPYFYKMIGEDFEFDTTKLKKLGWKPTLTNEQMLLEAFLYYRQNKSEILARNDLSAHRQPSRMGIIRLLKWVS